MRRVLLAAVACMLVSCGAAPAATPSSSISPTPSPTGAPALMPTPASLPGPTHANDPAIAGIPVNDAAPSIGTYGLVRFTADANTAITELTTTLTVPPTPLTNQGLFLWPGLQPQGANYEPIDNGVLQPVLAWGGVCGPPEQPPAFSTWWASGIYTNTYGRDPNHIGCYGGADMGVQVGDKLVMHLYLDGTDWVQTITDLRTGQMVSYSIDMQNQAQNHAYFVIESYGGEPVGDVVFTDTAITFATATPGSCYPAARGPNDFVAQSYISPDGMHCAVSEIVLRAQGVPAADPEPGP